MGAVHVTVMCPDVDAALRFYRHGLGLTRIQEWEGVQATAVEGDVVYDGRFACIEMGTDSYLELYPAATASGPESMNAPHVLGMAVHDVDETYRRCVATGGERLDVDGWDGEPRTIGLNDVHGTRARVAFVRGPSGEIIRLFQPLADDAEG